MPKSTKSQLILLNGYFSHISFRAVIFSRVLFYLFYLLFVMSNILFSLSFILAICEKRKNKTGAKKTCCTVPKEFYNSNSK